MVLTSMLLEMDPPRMAHAMADKFINRLPIASTWSNRTGQFTGLPEHAERLLADERLLIVFPEGHLGTAKLYPERYSLVNFGTGFVRLYNGADLTNWKQESGHKGHWVAKGPVLSYDGKSQAKDKDLWSEKTYSDFVLVADWRLPAKPLPRSRPTFTADGLYLRDDKGQILRKEILDAGDSGLHLRGNPRYQVNIWSQPMGSGDINDLHKDAALPEAIRRVCLPKQRADAPFGQWNRFIITLRGNRVTVLLNGVLVIDRAELPSVPPRGPLGLQNHGDPVEFRNLFLKERE